MRGYNLGLTLRPDQRAGGIGMNPAIGGGNDRRLAAPRLLRRRPAKQAQRQQCPGAKPRYGTGRGLGHASS